MHATHHLRNRQRGFSLAEVLVASAIFTIIIIAALLIYDRSNQVFKASTEAVDLQQNTRVAFDKLVADVRMTGFDYDRDGIPTGVQPTTWQAGTVYAVGDIVVPSVANGSQYVCTQGGTSAGTQPVWPGSGSVTDNTVIWQQNTGVNVYQQPDEQIEYAGQTAITIRANFDYDANQTSDRFNGRETSLEGATPQFPVITTNNDEIVTYALSKPSIVAAVTATTAASGCTAASTNCVHFFADVNSNGATTRRAYPGGTTERAVDIKGLDLTNNAPPYTLYRITLASNGDAVYTPVAENIRSLRFKYYEDTSGSTALKNLDTTPLDVSNGIGGEGPFDPNNSTAVIPDRLIRAKIKSIQIELIGMNPNADKNYTDTEPAWTGSADTVSPNTRKVMLSTLVVPRNLGKRGQRIQSTQEPGAPAITKVCIGYCGLAQITWQAPLGGGVTSYNILYDTSPNGSFTRLQPQGLVSVGYAYGLTPNVPYYFRIQALNDYGSSMSETFPNNAAPQAFTLQSATTPNNPSAPVPSTGISNEVDVTWQRPTTYSSSANTITCSPGGPQNPAPPIPNQEAITYNVWRSNTTPVNTGGAPYISYSTSVNAPSTNTATGQVTLKDTNVANCVAYYYAVQAVKPGCEPSASYYTQLPHSAAVAGTSPGSSTTTGAAPAAPSDLTVLTSSTCSLGQCTVNLEWPRVTADTTTPTAKPIVVDIYEISRTQTLSNTATTAAGNPTSTVGSNTAYAGTVTWQTTGWSFNPASLASISNDTVPLTDISGTNYQYKYKVRAFQCSTPGNYGPERKFPCDFQANPLTVTMSPSLQGDGSSGNPFYFDTPNTITVTAGANVNTITAIMYTYSGGSWTNATSLGTRTGPIASTTFSLAAASATYGTRYRFDIAATDTTGCTNYKTIEAIMEGTNCCLRQLADDPAQASSSSTIGVIRGFSAGTSTSVDVYFENICTTPLVIQPNGIVLRWDDAGLANGTKIGTIEYPTVVNSGTGVGNCTFASGTKCYTYNVPGSANDKGTYTAPTTTAASTNTTPQNIPASSSLHVRVTFTKALAVMPIVSMNVQYRRSTDSTTTTCDIIP